jgi:hypothetical protein
MSLYKFRGWSDCVMVSVTQVNISRRIVALLCGSRSVPMDQYLSIATYCVVCVSHGDSRRCGRPFRWWMSTYARTYTANLFSSVPQCLKYITCVSVVYALGFVYRRIAYMSSIPDESTVLGLHQSIQCVCIRKHIDRASKSSESIKKLRSH